MSNSRNSIKILLENDHVIEDYISECQRFEDEFINEGFLDDLYQSAGFSLGGRRFGKSGRAIASLGKKFPQMFVKTSVEIPEEEIEDFTKYVKNLYKAISEDSSLSGKNRNKLITDLRKKIIKAITGNEPLEKRAPRTTREGQAAMRAVETGAGSTELNPNDIRKSELETILRTLIDVDENIEAAGPESQEAKKTEIDPSEKAALAGAIRSTAASTDQDEEIRKQAQQLMSIPTFAAIGYPGLVKMITAGVSSSSGAIGSLQDVSDIAPEDLKTVDDLYKTYLKQRLPSSRARIRSKNLLRNIAKIKDDLEDNDEELSLDKLHDSVFAYNDGFSDKISDSATEKLVEILAKHFGLAAELTSGTKLNPDVIQSMKQSVFKDFSAVDGSNPPSEQSLMKLLGKLNDAGLLNPKWTPPSEGDGSLITSAPDVVKEKLSPKMIKRLMSMPPEVTRYFNKNFYDNALGRSILTLANQKAIKESFVFLILNNCVAGITPIFLSENNITFITN